MLRSAKNLPPRMPGLHNKLLSDYTLFNLNDPATTRFYMRRIDYLIANFPYFRDIAVVGDYLTSGNTRFAARFRSHLPKFVEVLYRTGDGGAADGAAVPPSIPFVPAHESDRSAIAHLYPSDESGPESDSTGLNEDPGSADTSMPQDSSEGDAGRALAGSLGALGIGGDGDGDAPAGGPPSGDEFTVNPTAVVLRHYSRVMQAHIGSYAVTNRLMQALIDRLEYEDIHTLLVALLQHGTVLPMLVKNNCVARIINKNLKSLHALLESVLYSSRNNIEDEEDFVDQVEAHKDVLVGRFLEIGTEHGCIGDAGADADADGISRLPVSVSVEFTTIYKILHLLCLNRASVSIQHFRVARISRLSLYYLRLLSYNPAFNDPAFVKHLVSLAFSNPCSSHLLSSVVRIVIKTPPEVLSSAGFFERMYLACYAHVGSTKEVRGGTAGTQPALHSNSLFSFMVRLYIRYSSYIKATYPGWDVFHELMDAPCRLEKARYTGDSLDLLVEYEGFQRYVVENMLNSLPYPSIFKK